MSELYVLIGECPVSERNIPPTKNANTNEPAGTAKYSHLGDERRGSNSILMLPIITTVQPLLVQLLLHLLHCPMPHAPQHRDTALALCRRA